MAVSISLSRLADIPTLSGVTISIGLPVLCARAMIFTFSRLDNLLLID
jgi:hypothetical protein